MSTIITQRGYTGDGISIPDAYQRADYRQPPTDNYLLNTSFRFMLNRTPNMTWFCQRVAIPALSFGQMEQPTPFGSRLPVVGTQYDFEDLTIDFIIDEEMKTWIEIYDWMTNLSNPNGDNKEHIPFEEQTSDAELLILSSAYNPKYSVSFKNIFPVSLGAVQFDSTTAETEPVVSTATFKYRFYEIETIS